MSIRHPLELLISMIYQNETWADPAVTSTIDSDIETAKASQSYNRDGLAGCSSSQLMARRDQQDAGRSSVHARPTPLTWCFAVERVTGIEPALSAWESGRSGAHDRPDLRIRCTAGDRHKPCDTRANGPPMARGPMALAAGWPRDVRKGNLMTRLPGAGHVRAQADSLSGWSSLLSRGGPGGRRLPFSPLDLVIAVG